MFHCFLLFLLHSSAFQWSARPSNYFYRSFIASILLPPHSIGWSHLICDIRLFFFFFTPSNKQSSLKSLNLVGFTLPCFTGFLLTLFEKGIIHSNNQWTAFRPFYLLRLGKLCFPILFANKISHTFLECFSLKTLQN